MRLRAGDSFPARELVAVSGERVRIPDPESLVHLQLRRFAGCPICNLHLRSFVSQKDELDKAGIREVAVLHSPTEELAPHASDLPFAAIPNPDKRLYLELGAESPPLVPRGGRLGLPADFLIARDGRVVACKYGEHADDQWSIDELLAIAQH